MKARHIPVIPASGKLKSQSERPAWATQDPSVTSVLDNQVSVY